MLRKKSLRTAYPMAVFDEIAKDSSMQERVAIRDRLLNKDWEYETLIRNFNCLGR